MEKRAFGKGGPEVPVIGLGTWQMERDPRAATLLAIQQGLDAGATHIDTAEMYGDGRVEALLPAPLARRAPARGHAGGVRGASQSGQDPRVRREQFR